jgi:hypothetical protein
MRRLARKPRVNYRPDHPMREDGDFLSDLRQDMADARERRHKFVIAKLTFVTGLLGLGLSGGTQALPTGHLLLLVPLVTFVFDLSIMGEDFAVKRIGKFMSLVDGVPPLEALWEKSLGKVRDRFSSYSAVLSSALALVAAAAGYFRILSLAVAIPCTVVGVLFIVIVYLNRRWQEAMLNRLAPAVRPRRSRAKKRKAKKKLPARAPANPEPEPEPEPERQPALPL